MIIGIVGLIGSGKDTIASHLVKNYSYERYSWAMPLKDITARLFGWNRDMLEGTTSEQRDQREIQDDWWSSKLGKNWSPRSALQYMGTEVMRNALHTDIWVLAGQHWIAGKSNVVIPDTRFPNEITAIREMGGVIWNVRRSNVPDWCAALTGYKAEYTAHTSWDVDNFMKSTYPAVHASEYSWHGADFDAVIPNDGSVQDLEYLIDALLGNVTAQALEVSHQAALRLGHCSYLSNTISTVGPEVSPHSV